MIGHHWPNSSCTLTKIQQFTIDHRRHMFYDASCSYKQATQAIPKLMTL